MNHRLHGLIVVTVLGHDVTSNNGEGELNLKGCMAGGKAESLDHLVTL